MDYKVGEEIVLDNDDAYIISDAFCLDEKKYLFLINKNSKNLSLVRVENDTIKLIEDDEEFSKVSYELISRNKKMVDEIMQNN